VAVEAAVEMGWLFGQWGEKKWRLRLKREAVGLWVPLLEKGCC